MKSKRMVALVLGAGTWLTACGGPIDDTPRSEETLGAQRAGLTASLSCSQDPVWLRCEVLVTEGVPQFTYAWTQRIFLEATGRYYTSGPTPGAASRSFSCRPPDETGTLLSSLRVSATVTDATGAVVHAGYSSEFSCGG
jgi:hypothetical protein